MFKIANKIRRLVLVYVILLVFVGVLFPSFVNAQVGVNVYDETVYHYLDKLASARLVKTYSPNQRPFSRYAVAKMVIEARNRCGDGCSGFTNDMIGGLESEFIKEIELVKNKSGGIVNFQPLYKVDLSYTATDQPEEPIPNNNLGTTSGRVQPLLDYNGGRHYDEYANFYFETIHWLELTPYFSAYLHPMFYTFSTGDNPKGGAKIQQGYLKGGYKNFELQAGRDEVRWGPGKYGGLFFTNNPRGLDMIRLTTPSTFRLPWYFSYLGQWRFTTFFSWMGTDYKPADAILSAYRIDYQPFYWWDIGFDHAVFMGGKGAKNPSVKTAVGEYIGFLFDSGNSRASSNHQIGFDMTIAIPPLKGAELYGKVLFEDTNKETELMYIHNASWLGGIYLPRVDSSGRLSIRGEFVRTGECAYRHWFYTDGFAIDGKMIGYDAGSDTYSGLLSANYIFNMDEFIDGTFRYLNRSSNTYSAVYDASGDQANITVATYGPAEHHFLFKFGGQKKLSKKINVYGELGLDYTKNKMFIQGKDALDFAVQIKFLFHGL